MVHVLLGEDECVPLPKEKLLMAEQPSPPIPPAESTLALSFLREDIQDVRQDVRQTNERMDTLRTELSGRIDALRTETSGHIGALRTETNERFDQMNGRIDALHTETNERFDQMNGRIDALRTETNERFDQMNGRFDQMNHQTNGRFDQTNGRIDELGKQLDSRYARLMTMLITCTGILVASLGTAVAVLK